MAWHGHAAAWHGSAASQQHTALFAVDLFSCMASNQEKEEENSGTCCCSALVQLGAFLSVYSLSQDCPLAACSTPTTPYHYQAHRDNNIFCHTHIFSKSMKKNRADRQTDVKTSRNVSSPPPQAQTCLPCMGGLLTAAGPVVGGEVCACVALCRAPRHLPLPFPACVGCCLPPACSLYSKGRGSFHPASLSLLTACTFRSHVLRHLESVSQMAQERKGRKRKAWALPLAYFTPSPYPPVFL